MGAQEVRQTLAPGGLAVGIAGSPQHRHKNLRLPDLSGARVHDRNRRPGIINEEFFARHMLLPHAGFEAGFPTPVMHTELRILVGALARVGGDILLPEQLQGHPLTP